VYSIELKPEAIRLHLEEGLSTTASSAVIPAGVTAMIKHAVKSFFSHLKTEIFYLENPESFDELERVVAVHKRLQPP
jgi:hypothetical protein